jgi:hypothetical protein
MMKLSQFEIFIHSSRCLCQRQVINTFTFGVSESTSLTPRHVKAAEVVRGWNRKESFGEKKFCFQIFMLHPSQVTISFLHARVDSSSVASFICVSKGNKLLCWLQMGKTFDNTYFCLRLLTPSFLPVKSDHHNNVECF